MKRPVPDEPACLSDVYGCETMAHAYGSYLLPTAHAISLRSRRFLSEVSRDGNQRRSTPDWWTGTFRSLDIH
jgi:hypothetical protein